MADTNNELVNLVLGEKPGEVVVGSGRGSALCHYWKRPTDGWITVIAAHVKTDAPAYAEFISKGFKPLPYYFGVEEVYKGTMLGGDGTRQFEKFIAAGGLDYIDTRGEFGDVGEYLMPATQIVQMNWHRSPAVREKRPDVASIVDLPCPHKCIDKVTGKVSLFASQVLLDKHLDTDPDHRATRTQYAMTETLTKVLGPQAAPAFDIAAMREEIKAELRAEFLETLRAEAAPPPPIPAAPVSLRYPEGSPDESWSRQNLMAWAKDNGYSAALSPSLNTAETLAAINNARLVSAGT